jgi:hypothetical protein
MRALLAALLLVVVALCAPSARASDDVRLTLDWAKFVDQSWAFVKHETEQPASGSSAVSSRVEMDRAWLHSYMGASDEERAPWVVFTPHLTLVARDWHNARILSGDVLALTDQMRVTRSTRMVFGRVHLAGGRVAPFAQFGVGEWRVDRDIVPNYACDQELAAQLGFGVESKVSRAAALALETDYTMLARDGSQVVVAQNLPTSRFVGVLAAARFSF